MHSALVAVLLCIVALAGVVHADSSWDERAGDNANLMQMFQRPQTQQQQQAPQATPQAAQLIAQVASLLQAAAQTQTQAQQQQPQQEQVATPFQNLYGARSAPQPQQIQQDPAFLATAATPQRDTILPLARAGTSGYLFSASHPPADVAARRRAAAPRHVSQLSMMGSIPRPRTARRSPVFNRLINLEKDTRQAPRRALPRPVAQKRFRLRSARRRAPRAIDASHMKRVLSSNPFLAKLQPDADSTEFLEESVQIGSEIDSAAEEAGASDADAEAQMEFESDADADAAAESDSDSDSTVVVEQHALSAAEADALDDAALEVEMADEMAEF